MKCMEELSSYKQVNIIVLWDKVKHVKREIKSGYIYHSHSYKLIANKTDTNKGKERFGISKDDSTNSLNQTDKILSTSDKKLVCSTSQTNKKRFRPSTLIFNKELCIICLSNEDALHKVAFESTGKKCLM